MSFAFKLPFREDGLPIKVEQSTWAHIDDGRRMRKTYEFTKFKAFHSFVSELLVKIRQMQHEADLHIVGMKITVTMQTQIIDDVSDLDLELSRFCDELFEDVKGYYRMETLSHDLNE
jgi:pterin-4a-carbinolamine dehydratase